ncbi:hypothetical protein Adi01nite_01060 [Amorphoplanes digitatis]|nr:hypothetical protein Adi01nite_01060 [Actinoplanes digitatis]
MGRAGAGRDGGASPGRPAGPGHDGGSPADAARRDAWDNPDRHSTPVRDRTATTDPVDIVSGEVFMAQTDVALPGVLPLVLERTYLSSYRLGRAFGHAWASTLDMRLEPMDAGMLLVMPDGMLLAYREMPTRTAVYPQAGPALGLTTEFGGYSVSSAAAGVTWHFSGDGLHLTSLTHRCGDRVDLVRDLLGRVTEVIHSGGYRVSVSWDNGRVSRFALLRSDGIAIPLARFGYDGDGLLADIVNGSGRPLRFEYDDGRLTRWIDRNGHWYSYAYDDRGRCVASSGPQRVLATRLEYDESTRTTVVTDALGHVASYRYDERRRVVREVDPVGGVRLREWDRRGRIVGLSDPTGAFTRHRYDVEGNLVQVTGPGGAVSTATCTAEGLPATVTGPDGSRRSFSYDARANLATVTDAAGAVTAYTYDQAGHLATVTDPLGAVTLVESDGAGLPLRVTDAAGATTSYQRDEAGRVVAVTDALGSRTLIRYSLDGLPTARTGPDGAVENWEYDPQGNLVAHTTASGAVTRYAYGPFNCLTSRTDPDGTRLAFAYDKQLRLTSVTNPQGLVWSYGYDGSGRLTAETDFDGRTITYATDAAGRLAGRTNGAGQTTTFVRDTAGRVVERHTAEGRTTFSYDLMGRLLRATSPTADLAMTYDAAGRVVSESVGGRTVRFSYDLAGRQAGRSTPAGVVSSWAYGATGSPTALLAGRHAMALSHDAVGNLIERRVGAPSGWQALRQEHDASGRLVAQTVAGSAGTTVQRGFAYGPDGFLSAVTDSALGTRTVALDQVGRVNAVTGASWRETYAYDTAGNLSSAAWTADDTAAQGERTYTGTRLRTAGRFRYEHDAQGRIVLRQRARHSGKPLTWRYTWDSEDRLVAVRTPDGSDWSYRYDPLGRRLAKYRHAPDGGVAEQVDFAWDGSRLIEQTHHRFEATAGTHVTTWDYSPGAHTPLVQRERRWTDSTPQAEIDEHFYSIVADLVGNPTHLTAVDGRVAWESRQTIWGTPTTVTSDGADCPLRLPGQYHDPETGHHYNNQRYYDPDTARYLSPDPLGLRPAPNPVAYVPNPTFEIDPLGLDTTPVGPTPEQVQHAIQNVGGLGEAQARMILAEAFKRGSSVVFGGSRVRGDYTPGSDVDVGFGSLTNNQANKLIKKVNGVDDDPSWLRMEETKIIPGNETPNIPRIESPEEFFARSGNRQPDDKGGAAYTPSGSHTYNPDGSISSRCPG